MDKARVYRRVLRRETHASRTTPAVVAAAVLIVLIVAGFGVMAWSVLDVGIAHQVSTYPARAGMGIFVAVGCIGILLAGFFLAAALLPGRRARRARTDDEHALLVDDGVLADATADAVAARCGIARSQVSVVVGRRSVRVEVVPTSGVVVDEESARQAAVRVFDELGFVVDPTVVVAQRGVVA
ncbi:hypothetical protein OED01_15555 [Microbacterium sp. M28]|uniref:hypothetical protein n=1 Tax=Microbacterium sp. M28 TaxID=2962064 RepID=UPI0021F43EA0|nr:hypothetical protein [Microbacterium sp. M28]UYO96996.1 hypothetical protein OED01_15555 [Microbacterium sp. M28]